MKYSNFLFYILKFFSLDKTPPKLSQQKIKNSLTAWKNVLIFYWVDFDNFKL